MQLTVARSIPPGKAAYHCTSTRDRGGALLDPLTPPLAIDETSRVPISVAPGEYLRASSRDDSPDVVLSRRRLEIVASPPR